MRRGRSLSLAVRMTRTTGVWFDKHPKTDAYPPGMVLALRGAARLLRLLWPVTEVFLGEMQELLAGSLPKALFGMHERGDEPDHAVIGAMLFEPGVPFLLAGAEILAAEPD